MADSYSFDITSEINSPELDNAINNAVKELENRYDFRGTNPQIKRDKFEIHVEGSDEFKVQAIWDVFTSKAIKRGIDLMFFELGKIEPAANARAKQNIKIVNGIDREHAKSITTLIKDQKFKAQTQIQDNQIRVTSKDKDTLQAIMQAVKAMKLPIPVQFGNYR